VAGRDAGVGTPLTAGGVYRGWVVVAAAFSVLFFAYGLQFSFGVFVTGMSAELGWTRAQTAAPYAVYVFAYGAFSVVTGRLTDRHGPRPVIAIGAVLLGLGWGASALVTQPWHLHVTLGCVAALGMSVTWVPCNATVSRWFTRRRGTAVAIASTGGSLGNLVVPTLAAALVAAWGWRVTLAALACTAALSMLVAARHMIRDPEAVGLWPDGAASAPPPSPAGSGRRLAEVRFTWPFMLVVAMYFMTWVPVFVPFVHAVAFAEDLGLGKIAAASVLTAIGAGGVVGRLASGWVSDRIGRLNALLIVFALQALAFILFAQARDLAWLWAAATVFGFSYGGTVTLLPPLCGDLFGRAHVAAIVGMIFALAGAPAAIGPYFAGWAYDVSGSYVAAFYASAAFNLVAFVLAGVLLALIAARRQAWHE